MKSIIISLIVLSFLFMSCQSKEQAQSAVALEETGKRLVFPIGANSTLFIKALFPFIDKSGTRYLTYKNHDEPEIYVYDIETQQLVKTIRYQKEGPDGTGPRVGGYLMKDWNEIYLPNLYTQEISVIDSSGHKLKTINFAAYDPKYPFIPTRSNSFVYIPMVLHQDKLYCTQLMNRELKEKAIKNSPVEFVVDLKKHKITCLPMKYPSTVTGRYFKPSLGIETGVSRCFDGERLVYSFSFDEDLYVASLDHKEIKKVKAKSSYIDRVKLPEKIPGGFDLGVKMMCEVPFYWNIIYDKYREVYYRFVFPQTELGNDENFPDLWQFGRSRFSVMILDKDFNVIGETLFPDNKYVSILYFVDEDGLYIGDNHYKSESFSEDILSFSCFKLSETPKK